MNPRQILELLQKEIGIIPNEEKAAQEWFKYAYVTGNEKVQKALLELLKYNVIRPANKDELALWILRTVIHGNLKNKKYLRSLYYEGHGTDKTRKSIVEYFEESAKKDDLESLIFMGHIHTTGLGVEKSSDLAHFWYKKAAKKGDAASQVAVGDYHYHKKEYDLALSWYDKAAKQNNKTANLRLSRMYKLGLGVTENLKKSNDYKNKAVKLNKIYKNKSLSPQKPKTKADKIRKASSKRNKKKNEKK